jgi:hypothetical protein
MFHPVSFYFIELSFNAIDAYHWETNVHVEDWP